MVKRWSIRICGDFKSNKESSPFTHE